MRNPMVSRVLVAFSLIVCFAFLFVGCMATSPAITSDTAAISAATSQQAAQITTVQAQLAKDEAALAAVTAAATTQPNLAPQIAALQQVVANDEQAIATTKAAATTQMAALQAQLMIDEATAKNQQIQTGVQIGQTAAAAAPAPWGWIIAGVVGIAGTIATTYQTNGKLTAQSVIAAAAPGVARLVGQATDNQTLATDISTIGQVSPAVIDLLAHPAAKTAAPIVTNHPVVSEAVSVAKA